MTRPGDLGPEEQKQLLDSLATLVADSAPAAWERISIEYKCIGRHVELGIAVDDSNGRELTWDPPAEIDELFWKLRVGMYREGVGTWFSAFFRMSPPNTYEIFYNRDNEPPWNPSAESFQKEQDLFPRDAAHTPAWFSQKLAGTTSGD